MSAAALSAVAALSEPSVASKILVSEVVIRLTPHHLFVGRFAVHRPLWDTGVGSGFGRR
jgi:hypothetical protein